LEIEERLVQHPAIGSAVVVGLKDEHDGEAVGAFLGLEEGHQRPGKEEVADWVRRQLGRHKAPTHVFWLGHDGVPGDVPLTGSGKVRKFEMAQLGNKLLENARKTSKL
jgi:mevalonyl-CoA ligase